MSAQAPSLDGPRQRLLCAAVEYVLDNGLSELSLRELAAAIGTSHRMLIYHFGSKEGLLVAIIRSVEAAQRDFFAELVRAQPDLSPGEGIRVMWRHFTDPRFAPHERLFFEMYAQALQSRPGTTGLLDDIVDAWVDPVAAYAINRGIPQTVARAEARLGVAVIRGLLLDLLATKNGAAVDAALERYIAQYEAIMSISADAPAAAENARTDTSARQDSSPPRPSDGRTPRSKNTANARSR